MQKPLRVWVSRVQSTFQQSNNADETEISIVGFGITGFGQRIMSRPVSLGTYQAGEDRDSNLPILINAQIHNTEDLVALCLWLIEDVQTRIAHRGGRLEFDFNQAIDAAIKRNESLGLEPKAIHLYSFAESMTAVRSRLQEYASRSRSGGDILPEHFQHLHPLLQLPTTLRPLTFEFHITSPKYHVTCEYQFERMLASMHLID